MARKNVKSAEPKKKRPISLNILEIAKRLQKLEETGGGEPYTLPTASAETKGGVKIGSGLTMTDEVLSTDAVSASDVSYDNTDSGLTATSVQDAIDELAGGETSSWVQVINNKLYYKQIGQLVYLKGQVENNKPTFSNLGNLPAAVLPDHDLSFALNDVAMIKVQNNAYSTVVIKNTDTDNSYWFQFSYSL